MPGRSWIVCLPAVGQRQANKTVLGRLAPELDLFCQIPVVSTVSLPSMKMRACPAWQHRSPRVPIRAMPAPVKVIEIGSEAVVIERGKLPAQAQALVVAGVPLGSRPTAATASA